LDGIQSINRALSILKALSANGNIGSRLTDIVDTANLTKSTTYRILQALVQAGLVEQDPKTGLYFLGYDLFRLGIAAGNRLGLADLARPSMERLAERTGDTVYLSIRDRFEAVCIARVEGNFPIKTLTLTAGDRRPLGVGAGSLAILASMRDEDARAAIYANFGQRTPYPKYDESSVYGMIEDSKRRGYSINDSNVIEGMSALGVPIRDASGVVGAISVAAITERMLPPRQQNIAAWLLAEATEIEKRLLPLDQKNLQFKKMAS